VTTPWEDIAEARRPELRSLVEDRIIPLVAESERTQLFPVEIYRILGEHGFLSIGAPVEQGGGGGGRTAEVMVVEELASASAGVTMSVVPMFIVRIAIFEFGGEQVIEEVGRKVIAGDRIVGICMSEPDAGSDVASITTRATRVDGGWSITGSKMFITNGTIADDLMVVAKVDDPELGAGIGLFLTETAQPGFQALKLDKDASRGSDTTELRFEGCFVPDHRVLGSPTDGFRKAMRVLNGERILSAARAIQLAQDAWADAVAWAAVHDDLGQPALEQQAYQGPLATAHAELWAARLALSDVCRLWDEGDAAVEEASMLKDFATHVSLRVTREAQRLMGVDGLEAGSRVARNARDARLGPVTAGSEQIMHRLVARAQGWPAARH
jgi:acyl-CoA dehydrogenase